MSGSDGGHAPGRVAVVLHTHMPYVEGYGTWPFGEEWLWEAIAMSYLPLLAQLDDGAPLTLSLTPVLCDQLAAPGALERCLAFLREIRPASHALDAEWARARGEEDVALELERAAGEYAAAADALAALDGALPARLGAHAAWTSAATHAVLPLVATDAGVRLQVETGIASHRERFGAWRGGFWLPECAHEPWLDPLLEEAGVHAVCAELTDVLGLGDPRHLTPLRTVDGPLVVPIDRILIDRVWAADGYPQAAEYRDSFRRTPNHHHPWANDGAVYDAGRARERARADAADLVARCRERVAGGGLCVLAFDTELFGHWWHEGPAFLAEFVDEARRTGLALTGLDDALADAPTAPWPVGFDGATTWGDPHTLLTWSNPAVADMASRQREAELRVVAAGASVSERAVRELLAVQASDWPFLISRDQAGEYPRERFDAHLRDLESALEAVPSLDAAVRNLAPHLTVAPLLEP